jgi:hypothetical protein
MPMIMVWAVYPIAFEDRGTEILLHSQWFDVTRTVHMDVDVGEATPPASALGHSVGRWEGGALVIDTTAINWPYFDAGGTRQSDAVEVREEFRVSADESRLDYSMTVIDPVMFLEPATVTTHWLALGEQLETYDCLAQ